MYHTLSARFTNSEFYVWQEHHYQNIGFTFIDLLQFRYSKPRIFSCKWLLCKWLFERNCHSYLSPICQENCFHIWNALENNRWSKSQHLLCVCGEALSLVGRNNKSAGKGSTNIQRSENTNTNENTHINTNVCTKEVQLRYKNNLDHFCLFERCLFCYLDLLLWLDFQSAHDTLKQFVKTNAHIDIKHLKLAFLKQN